MNSKMEIMEMSLDEYISMSKKSNDALNTTNKSNNKGTFDNDTKFGRRRGNIDDEEDEDLLLKSDDEEDKYETVTGIWKGPDASLAYIDCDDQKNDLREKLKSNNNNKNREVSSVQYRLMAPNNSADRPRGIPTLLPLDAYVHNHQHQNGGYNNNNKAYRNKNRRRNRWFNNNNRDFDYHKSNNNMVYVNNCNRVGRGIVNCGRIQRNRNPNLSFSHGVEHFNAGRFDKPPQQTSKDITITCPSSSINFESGSYLKPSVQMPHCMTVSDSQGNKSMPIGNLTPQAQAALNLNANTSSEPSSSNDNLKSLLGFQGNVSGEMMPVFASRLLEFLQNNGQAQVHKPIYDMKLQKDIHEIQKKPMLYKCNGGEVISSDGAGVNCEIIPRTSGISLNCRFA